MSCHEKEGEQEDAYTERQGIIDNPIPTSLFICYAAVLFFFVATGGCNFRTNTNTCKCLQVVLLKSKDVEMRLSMISCIFPFFFMT